MDTTYQVNRGEEVLGQYTSSEIASLRLAGELKDTDYVWEPESQEWLTVANFQASKKTTPTKPVPAFLAPSPKRKQTPPLGTIAVCLGLLLLGGYLFYNHNPKKVVIPSDDSKWDTELAPAIKKLNDDDKRLLTAYLVKAKMKEAFGNNEQMPTGLTVGNAIEEERKAEDEENKKEAEQKALTEQVNAQRAAIAQQIENVLTVALVEKGFTKADFTSGQAEDEITLQFAFQNKGQKDIAGFKGTARFTDMFGDFIYGVSLKYDEGIAAGQSATWDGTIHYNEFEEKQRKFRDTDKEKMKMEFVPEAIVFSDRTKLQAPEENQNDEDK